MLKRVSVLLPILAFNLLCACGLGVPQIKEYYDKDLPPARGDKYGLSGTAVLEYEIRKSIFCELKRAVMAARSVPYYTGDTLKNFKKDKQGLLPLDWVAEVSLSLQVDESTALNPGLSLNTPLPNATSGFGGSSPASNFAQSFGLGFGGSFSSASTRVDKFDPYWTVEYLNRTPQPDSVCANPLNDPVLRAYGPVSSSPFLIGDLGLQDWLLGSLFVSRTIESVGTASQVQGSPSGFHPDSLTLEIKFVVLSNGNVTPTWKLVRVSANTGASPLIAMGRMRTHDLIITIGPNKNGASTTHLASQIGNAVSNANRSQMMQ